MHVLVLMSTYNGEKYLQAQIESIMQQKILMFVSWFAMMAQKTKR